MMGGGGIRKCTDLVPEIKSTWNLQEVKIVSDHFNKWTGTKVSQ